jgi:hypothetical protein
VIAVSSLTAVKSGAPTPTPIERARTALQRLGAAFGALGDDYEYHRRELQIGARLLELDGRAAYRALRETLDRLSNVLGSVREPPVPEELRASIERNFLRLFVDYLEATRLALRGWVTDAVTKPNLATLSHLEERQRYARSAARGGGKAENEHFARWATKLALRHPELAQAVLRARQKLAESAERAHEIRMDLVGVDAGGLSLDERTRLLAFDASSATREMFEERLNAVETALARGARQFASTLFWELSSAPPRLDEEVWNRRLEAMRPAVSAAGREQTLVTMQLLLERGFDSPRDLEYRASSMLTSAHAPLAGDQLARARSILVRAFETRLAAEQRKLERAAEVLAASETLTDQNLSAARAVVQRPPIEPVQELSFLEAEPKAALAAALLRYQELGGAAQARVERMFGATEAQVSAEYAAILALPNAEQEPRLKGLHLAARAMESLCMWLGEEFAASARALTDAIDRRAFPKRRSV